MKQLKRTYLIQRLNKPLNPNNQISVFSFGGGLRNGGLSEDAMKLLKPIFSFDYMGSSEFEWGAIPKCLQSLAKNIKMYSTHVMEINKIPVYVICRTDFQKEIDLRIKELAKRKHHLKQPSNFDVALGMSEWLKKEKCQQIGWLELDNEFVFFTDKVAFEKTAEIFGLS